MAHARRACTTRRTGTHSKPHPRSDVDNFNTGDPDTCRNACWYGARRGEGPDTGRGGSFLYRQSLSSWWQMRVCELTWVITWALFCTRSARSGCICWNVYYGDQHTGNCNGTLGVFAMLVDTRSRA